MYIVATISKNSFTADKIEEIIRAGATVLRYNFSHGTPEEMGQKINTAKEVIKKFDFQNIKILADLPGDKIRLGKFSIGEYDVTKDTEVTFKSAQEREDPFEFIPVDYSEIGKLVVVGQTITCGDGEVAFEVTKILDSESFIARTLNDRHIPALKALNIGRGIDQLEHFTPKTIAHIKNLSRIQPDWVAFSFVSGRSYLKRGIQLLHDYGVNAVKIVSKVESPLGLRNIENIAALSDVLLVARGDLGLYTPIELIGINQKKIVTAAKKAGKEVIVSTQILDSLLSYYVPSRADVLDLTNAILDGADGIMLAKETGISKTPGYSVSVAKRIIDAVTNAQ